MWGSFHHNRARRLIASQQRRWQGDTTGAIGAAAERLESRMLLSSYWWTPQNAGAAWSDPGNWSADPNGTGGAGVPMDGDDAYNVSNQPITYDGSFNGAGLSTLTLDSAGGNAALNLSSHTLAVANSTFYGGLVLGGTDTGQGPDFGQGCINLSGTGSLNVTGNEEIGFDGAGTITQTGGTHTIDGEHTLFLGRNPDGTGSYFLSANGTLNAGSNVSVGYQGTGTFVQTGGVANIGDNLFVGDQAGSTGSYTMSGPSSLTAAFIGIGGEVNDQGGVGAFTLNGGSVTVSNAPGPNTAVGNFRIWSNSSLYVNGGSLSTDYLVNHGTIDVSGGTINVSSDLLSDPTSTYVARLDGAGGRIDVGRPVNLNDSNLVVTGAAPANSYTLINDIGTGPVTGTFHGLPEGAAIRVNGRTFHITYRGGDGNDVVLTAPPPRSLSWDPQPGNSVWDHTTPNWLDSATNSQVAFNDGDSVSFTDTGAGAVNIEPGGVAPSSVTFNADAGYNIEGNLASGNVTTSGPGIFAFSGGTFTVGQARLNGTVRVAGTLNITGAGSVGYGINIENGGVFNTGPYPFEFHGGPANTVLPGGTLSVGSGGILFSNFNPIIELDSDATTPGRLLLNGNIDESPGAGLEQILSGGSGANPGVIDVGVSDRTITSNTGYASPGLLITAKITGTGGIIKSGPGNLTLAGANDYAGATTVTGGVLTLGSSTALGSTAGGTSVAAAALLDLNGQAIGAEAVTFAANSSVGNFSGQPGGLNQDASLAGLVTLDGPVTYVGAPALSLNGQVTGVGGLIDSGYVLVLSNNANDYSGGTSSGGSVIRATADHALGRGPVHLTGGSLQLVSTVGLHMFNSVNVNSGSPSIVVDDSMPGAGGANAGAVHTLGGVFVAAGATLNADGFNQYQLALAGDLEVMGTVDDRANTPINVAGRLSGTGTISEGTVVVAGTASPGAAGGNGLGTLTFDSSALVLAPGSTYDAQLDASGDQLNVNGSVTLTGSTLAASGPAPLGSYTILKSAAVTGTFNGLPEGAAVVVNGRTFHITYQGGDGNDVVLVSADSLALSGTTVAEHQPAGTPVGTLSTGGAPTGAFTYAVVSGTGGDDNASFTIGGLNGDLLETAAPLDLFHGTYHIRVRSTSAANPGSFAEETFVVTAVDAPITATPTTIVVGPNVPFSGVVAQFTDADSSPVYSLEFNATIDWGDGTTSSASTVLGSIVADARGNGTYDVRGSHTYTDSGQHSVGVSISDAGGASATVGTIAAPPPEAVLIPAYLHVDDDASWQRIADAGNQTAAIIDPYFGPNAPGNNGEIDHRSDAYAQRIDQLRARGVTAVGYIHTHLQGILDPAHRRPLQDVENDITNWNMYYPGELDGFFVDEMEALPASNPDNPASVGYYADLYGFIKSLNPAFKVIGNPGSETDQSYFFTRTTDTMTTLEGVQATYASYVPPAWAWLDYPADRFANIIHTGVGDVGTMLSDLKSAREHNIGNVFFSDAGSVYDTLPSFWEQEVAAVHAINLAQANANPSATVALNSGDPAFITGLNDIVASAQGAGATSPAPVQVEVNDAANLNAVIAAIGNLTVSNSPPVYLNVDASQLNYQHQMVTVPAGVKLTLNFNDATITAGSPALTLVSGDLTVENAVFTNSTGAPTILVKGGTLTLLNDTVQRTGPGALVENDTATPVSVQGTTTFLADGQPIDQNLQGMVWVDFNNDGNVDFGEQGINGVTVTLSGRDDLGDSISITSTTADGGVYCFNHIRPGTYRITESATSPAYTEGKDAVGTLGGDASVQDVFSNVPVGVNRNGFAYNFGEQPSPGGAVSRGQAAGIGFWANKNGQALIARFNTIGPWLADTMPNTFGVNAGANNLANKSPAQVAQAFLNVFVLKDKLDAQVMSTALNVYATNTSLGGLAATAFGFNVGQYGLGDSTWNVGGDGAAFGVADNAVLTVMQLLQDWDGDPLALKTGKNIRQMALEVFGGINTTGAT